ncbi:MAG: hypothetical protein P1V81_03960 [Planctomycetota bacterium]|nr:hypothetical protein [Planctomycetota bacterium]
MKIAHLLLPTLLALATTAGAQTTVTWTGASDASWDNPGNWSPLQVPGSLDHAIVGSALPAPVASGLDKSIAQLTVQSAGSLSLSGADVIVSGTIDLDGSVSSTGATERLRGSGDLDVGSTGSYSAGGALALEGSGTMTVHASAPGKPVVEILGGTRTTQSSTLDGLVLTAGSLEILDNRTLTVAGDVALVGGTLNFDTTIANWDTLHVNGNLQHTATAIGTTTTQSRIYVAGDWIQDGAFSMPSGWIYLDGADSAIGGLAPSFHRVQLSAGVNTLNSNVAITGELKTLTGSTTGTGWLEFYGSVAPHNGGNDLLHQVRIVSGVSEFRTSLIGELEVVGGTLHLVDFCTLTIQGDAILSGGTLSFDTLIGNFDTINIAGDLVQTGTAVGSTSTQTRIYVEGDWTSDAAFVLPEGWIYLDGGDSTIGGTTPTFKRLDLTSGTNTLLTDIRVNGQLKTTSGLTTGTGWVEFHGSVAAHLGSSDTIHQARIVAGTNPFGSATFGQLELVGGTMHLNDFATITVVGDAQLIGGELSFDTVIGNYDTLDVAGDLNQVATTLGTTSPQTRIYVNGDWTAQTPFVLADGWVYLDGAASSINGPAAAFKRLNLPTGVKTLNVDVDIWGTVTSNGGSTAGTGWVQMLASTENFSTGANLIHQLRVVSADVPFKTSKIGDFEMTGGSMLIQDFVTLSVTGDCSLYGGTLDFDTTVGNYDTLDIEGDFYQNGGILGTATDFLRIYCAGDWRSDTGFTLLNGWVYLDGLVNTTIDGLNPAFNNLRITNAGRTVSNGLHVRGDLEVQVGANLELLSDMEMGGDLSCFQSGASISGTGTIFMTGTGTMSTNSTPIPHCHISAGVRSSKNATLETLTLAGGELHINDFATLHVIGDANFGAGTLSFDTTIGNFDTINIDGDLNQSATVIGTTSPQSRIYVAGNWMAANPFELPEGWVHLDGGDAIIGGPAPEFRRLRLESGVKTVNTTATVSGTIYSTGGSTAGGGYLDCIGNTQAINTGTNLINRLRISGGLVPFVKTRIGELELVGGTMHLNDVTTVTVDGDARLIGGTLGFDTLVGNFESLDVNGDLTESGTVAGTTSPFSRVRVAGDWIGTGSFVMPSGWVELDGAPASSISGSAPTFGNLQILNGLRTLASNTIVQADLEVRTNGTLDVATLDLDVTGDLKSTDSGVSIVGDGPVYLSGDGLVSTNTLGTPPIEILGGTRSSGNATVAGLTLTGGTLHLLDIATLHVLGDADLVGGTLSFDTTIGNHDTLRVDGDLSQSGSVIGTTSAQSRIYVAGDWSADTPFELPSGWVYLDGGDAVIGGSAPTFRRLSLVSGDYSVETETLVSGTILSSGGSTSGPEWLTMIDSTQPITTGTNVLGRLRILAGTVDINTSRVGELELAGGELLIRNFVTLTVEGDANLLAGTLSFDTTVGNYETLNVLGSVTQTATVSGTSSSFSRFYCEGDWHSNSSFAMASGSVQLNGSGSTLLGGSIPGNDPTFPNLTITGGERRVEADTQLSATLVDVTSSGRLTVTADALRPVGTPLSISGVLDIEPTGRLAPDAASPITIQSVGRLELVGAPGQPAVLEGLGGGLDCTVNGTLAARDFEVRAPKAAGLVVNSGASLAPAPDDLRDGLFTLPDATAGSTLLTLNAGGGAVLPFLRFEDPLAAGTFNVRRASGGVVTLANASGGFEGATFEDDASNLIDWTTLTTSAIASFKAKPSAEKATLSWESTNESVDLSAWRIESAPTASGPFGLVTEVTATGPGTYSFVHLPLAADAEVHYRLFEKQTGGLVNLLAEDACTPWSAAQPANLATVGPGGDFATIQAAIDAATGPAAVISVAAGSYPSFSVIAPAATQLHIINDGSGSVLVDASTSPVEIAFTSFGQAVELVGVEITGGALARAVDVHDNLGSVLLDSSVVTGGAGQPGLVAAASLAVSIGRTTLTGTPGLQVGAVAEVYVGRGSIDNLDVSAGGAVQLSGLVPASTNALPGSEVVTHPGVMPDLQFGSFQSLGVPFSLDFEAAPASFYQLATSAGMFPLDLGDTNFWQMLLLCHFGNYSVVNQGFTHPTTGQVNLTVELPADGAFIGAVLPVQGWTIAVVPSVQVRFSNLRSLVAMP